MAKQYAVISTWKTEPFVCPAHLIVTGDVILGWFDDESSAMAHMAWIHETEAERNLKLELFDQWLDERGGYVDDPDPEFGRFGDVYDDEAFAAWAE